MKYLVIIFALFVGNVFSQESYAEECSGIGLYKEYLECRDNFLAKKRNNQSLNQCNRDFGTQDMFGSFDQLKYIQNKINENNCSFIQLSWKAKNFQGGLVKKMIAADIDDGMMIRATVMPYGKPSWEFWYGFDKTAVLKDDPSDGFDLPNYTTSFDSSSLSKELNKAIRSFK